MSGYGDYTAYAHDEKARSIILASILTVVTASCILSISIGCPFVQSYFQVSEGVEGREMRTCKEEEGLDETYLSSS